MVGRGDGIESDGWTEHVFDLPLQAFPVTAIERVGDVQRHVVACGHQAGVVKLEWKTANEASPLKSYLDLVPKAAYAGSCICHGSQGCALPRSMQNESCNRHLCYPVKQLGRDLARPGDAQLAVSTVRDREDRMLLLSDGETRGVRPRRWRPFLS